MSSRPTYSDEFKADTVALVDSSGRPLALVAAELGISLTALKRWVELAPEGQSGDAKKPDQPVEAAKYKALGVSLTCLNGSGRCYVDLQSRSIDGGDQRWSGCPLPLLELAQT